MKKSDSMYSFIKTVRMTALKKYVLLAAEKLDLIASAAIVAMMSLTCADVILRMFRRPIPGAYELVSFLGAIAVSFSIAHTSAERAHVAVSLLVRMLPSRIQGIVEASVALLSLVLFGLISWQCLVYGNDCRLNGEVSLTLGIPLYPVIYGVAFGASVVCLVQMVDLINAIETVRQS